MIELKIDGEFVDLAPNAKVNVRINNPFFTDDDIIPGDYSLPFDLASPEMSGKNSAIFGNNDAPESTDSFKRKPAELFYDGVLFKKGEVINREVGDRMQVNMRFGMATIAEGFKALKLRDLMDEPIVIDASSVTKKVHIKPGGRFNFTGDNPIKINGRDYDGTTLANLVAAINADITTPRASATLVSSGTTPGGLAAPYITITSLASAGDPHVDLSVQEKVPNRDTSDSWIWQVEAEMSGYYAGFDSFFSSYKGAAPATNKFRIPAGYNDFYFRDGSGERILTNQLQSGSFLQNLPTDDSPNASFQFLCFNRNNLQPLVMLRYVFEKAAAYLGIGFEGDWVGEALYNSLLIHNTAPLGFLKPFVGEKPFLFWKRDFNIKDLVPDITFVDLLKALQSRYNLKISYNENTNKISIKKRETIARSTKKIDVSPMAGVASFVEDDSLTGLRLEVDKIDDKSFSLDYYNVGTPEKTWKVKCGEVGGGVRYTYNDSDDTKFPLRLIRYGGLVTGFNIYPVTNAPGTTNNENLSTLYENEWKRFVQQRIDRKVIEVPLYWGMAELSTLDMDVKYRYDRNDYFIAWLDVELTMTKINIKATLYKA